MSKRRRRAANEKPGAAGFLVVDKAPGQTSHDVVDAARRWLGTRRVGHLGTLDPQATGVLPLAVREATKLVPFFEEDEKHYEGTVRLGIETDTLDADGRELRRYEGALPDEATVRDALAAFRGDIEQIPPMYSAVKQGGVPLHRLARQGEEVRRAPKKVRIHRLELVEFASPDASLLVECSAGTYVRTLVADLGQTLGCGGYLLRIRRLRSGPFRVEQSLPAEACERAAQEDRLEDHFIRPAAALGVPEVTLADVAAHRIMNGGDVPVGTVIRLAPGSKAMAYDEQGRLLALVELRPDRRLYPLRVLRVAS